MLQQLKDKFEKVVSLVKSFGDVYGIIPIKPI